MSAKRRRPSTPSNRMPERTALRARPRRQAAGWELVPPPCARARAEDLDEVADMIEGGETEIAADELRWLLSGCHDCLPAHRLLGEIALVDQDWALARGHFGYAWELGLAALRAAGADIQVPASVPANSEFLASGYGLAVCLHNLAHHRKAIEVLERLLAFDREDPFGVQALLAEVRQAARTGRGPSLPVIEPPRSG